MGKSKNKIIQNENATTLGFINKVTQSKSAICLFVVICTVLCFLLSHLFPENFSGFVEVFELLYYIGFIILTTFLVFYAQQTLKIQKKPATLLARVNFNLDGKKYINGYGFPVTVDVYNAGDVPIENVEISFRVNDVEGKDVISYIAPHEDYDYCIGYINKEEIHWIIKQETKTVTKMSQYQMPDEFGLEIKGGTIKAFLLSDHNMAEQKEHALG